MWQERVLKKNEAIKSQPYTCKEDDQKSKVIRHRVASLGPAWATQNYFKINV